MKQQIDKHHSEISFYVGDWVFLQLDLKQDIYEKEMLALLHTINKLRPYLLGIHFKVKAVDHDSLKYFLEEILSLEEQRKWVTNMLGYDFEIIYKKRRQNVVVDALSRKD